MQEKLIIYMIQKQKVKTLTNRIISGNITIKYQRKAIINNIQKKVLDIRIAKYVHNNQKTIKWRNLIILMHFGKIKKMLKYYNAARNITMGAALNSGS